MIKETERRAAEEFIGYKWKGQSQLDAELQILYRQVEKDGYTHTDKPTGGHRELSINRIVQDEDR